MSNYENRKPQPNWKNRLKNTADGVISAGIGFGLERLINTNLYESFSNNHITASTIALTLAFIPAVYAAIADFTSRERVNQHHPISNIMSGISIGVGLGIASSL